MLTTSTRLGGATLSEGLSARIFDLEQRWNCCVESRQTRARANINQEGISLQKNLPA
jgi:hypothetical protein